MIATGDQLENKAVSWSIDVREQTSTVADHWSFLQENNHFRSLSYSIVAYVALFIAQLMVRENERQVYVNHFQFDRNWMD